MVQSVTLMIFDELHLIGEGKDLYEVTVTRARLMQAQLAEKELRFVALTSSVANVEDLARWMGIDFPSNTFNFHPSATPVEVE